MNQFRRFSDEHFRVAHRVQFILHPQHALRLRKRQIRHGAIGFANFRVAAVAGDSHDGVFDLRISCGGDAVSKRIRPWQVAIDKGLVDNGNFGRAGCIGILYVSAQPQRDSQCAQKCRSDKIRAHTCKGTIGSRVTPIHEHAVVVAVSAADTHFHDCRGIHSRQRAHALQQRRMKPNCIRVRADVRLRANPKDQQAGRAHAEVARFQVPQRAVMKTSGAKQDHTNRNLKGHHELAAPKTVSSGTDCPSCGPQRKIQRQPAEEWRWR